MSKQQIITNNELETMAIGERLAKLLKAGDVLTMEGELGAGKTTFTKGIAKGLGVERTVSSPTFTIVKEYEGHLPLYHMDAYRLENSDEDIGFDEYFNGSGISVVEWARFIEDYLPEELLNIRINYGEAGSRVLEFTTNSAHFEWVVNELLG